MLPAAVLVLIPLALTPGVFFYYDVTPKIIVLLFGTAAGLVTLVKSFGGADYAALSPAGRRFVVLLAAEAVSLVISTAFSTNSALSMNGTNWRRFGLVVHLAALLFAFVLLTYLTGRPERLKNLLRAVAASGCLAAAYGIAQYLGFDPILPAAGYHAGEGIYTIVRPPSTLGHAGYFANWLIYAVFFGIALIAQERQRWTRMLGAGAAILGSTAIVLSGTRAAVLGLLIGFSFLLIRNRPRVTLVRVVLPALLTAATGFFYMSPAGEKLRGRVHWSMEDSAGGARIALWLDALAMSAQRLPAGYGPETFAASFPKFQSEALSRSYPDFYHESPHNMFLDALTARGIPGMLILAGFVLFGLGAARSRRGFKDVAKDSRTPFAACLLAVLASQQFMVFVAPTAIYFYTLLAILAARDMPAASAREVPSGPRRLLTGAAIILGAVLCGYATRLAIADRYLALAAQNIEKGYLLHAATQYRESLAWQLPGSGSDLMYSRKMARAAQAASDPVSRLQAAKEAGEAALRATRTAEDPHNAWYNLAAFYGSQNDIERTEMALREAIRHSPNWFKPHWALAKVMLAAGRPGEAETEAHRAAELDGGKHQEVVNTVKEIREFSSR